MNKNNNNKEMFEVFKKSWKETAEKLRNQKAISLTNYVSQILKPDII